MHRASNFSNIGQGAITIIVSNQGCQSNRKKGHSRLFYSIRISLLPSPPKSYTAGFAKIGGTSPCQTVLTQEEITEEGGQKKVSFHEHLATQIMRQTFTLSVHF